MIISNPKVSIVIPVYNGGEYVKEAIESALAQTYENVEIVIVNDGSKDDGATTRVVSKYAEKYPDKIKFFEKENGGVSTALNLALEKMTGEYFSWLSHDDRYYPEKISKQIEYLKDFNEKTILYSDYDLMNSYSEVFATSKKDHEELMQKKEYALLRGAINGITLLIPKTAFDECGDFRVDLRCVQDYELWLRMMLAGFEFVHQPEVLATTRLHELQTTNTSPKVLSEGNPFWIDMIESFGDVKRIELEGSVFKYYSEMKTFLETTPYDGAIKHVEEKIKEEVKKNEERIKNTKVSVVIPFYNRFDCVKNAIQSVFSQTHSNYEIILVDDGSNDAKAYLSEFLADERVKYIDIGENKGPSNARNVGIENATGEYIAMLDSDDLFLPDKLEKQLSYMINSNADFSYTSYLRRNGECEVEVNCDMTEDMVGRCIYNSCIATPTIMIKKAFLEKCGIKYNVEISVGEDNCFYLDVLLKTPIHYLDQYLTIVNVNSNSASQNKEKIVQGIKNILYYVVNKEEYYKETRSVAYLSSSLVATVLDDELRLVPIYELEGMCSKPTNRLKRYWNALTKKGLLYCVRKVIHKVKYKLIVWRRKK